MHDRTFAVLFPLSINCIEGRMKRPEYVATVIEGYRKTIDEYLATNKMNV